MHYRHGWIVRKVSRDDTLECKRRPPLLERAGPQGEREDSWMRTVLTDVTPAVISVRQLQYTRVVGLVLGEW